MQTAWDRLLKVRALVFDAQSQAAPNTGWNGRGEGTVRVETVAGGVMLFREQGVWTPEDGEATPFTNVYRWTADGEKHLIRLEHLRHGPDQPVYLFDLVACGANVWASAEPHVCRDDLYSARMTFGDHAILLTWSIQGPKKAETIAYTYR